MPALTTPAVDLTAWRGSGPPTVTGEGLRLRPWSRSDVDVLVRAYANPGIQQWHVQSMTPGEATAWIDRWPTRWHAGTGADWAVTDTGVGAAPVPDSPVVGRIGFRHVDLHEGEAEVAYWVLPEARGRRVAARALATLVPWAAGVGLLRITLRHAVGNVASCRVAADVGFALEGTLRRAGRHVDGAHDMHLHARLLD